MLGARDDGGDRRTPARLVRPEGARHPEQGTTPIEVDRQDLRLPVHVHYEPVGCQGHAHLDLDVTNRVRRLSVGAGGGVSPLPALDREAQLPAEQAKGARRIDECRQVIARAARRDLHLNRHQVVQEDRCLGLRRGLQLVPRPSGLDLQLAAVELCSGFELRIDLPQLDYRRSGVAVMEADDVPWALGGIGPAPHQPGAVAAPARQTQAGGQVLVDSVGPEDGLDNLTAPLA